MKTRKSWLLVATFALLLSVNVAKAAEKPMIIISSTPFGTGSYAMASAFEAIINKLGAPFTLSHTETPGQAFNIQKLNKDVEARKNTICMAGPAINWLGENGKKPFKSKMEGLYLIGTVNVAASWLATDQEDINSIQDLADKRIALGRIPQIIWGYIPDAILRHGYSAELYKELNIQFVGTTESATALLNGQVDAATLGGYLNPANGLFEASPQTVEVLAASRPLKHLDWTEAAVKNTLEKDVYITPYQLAANTVPGMDKSIAVFTDPSSFVAHKDFPEEMAYEIAKSMIKYADKFAEYHALGKLVSKEALPFGWPIDRIHPGALRAYKEAGLIKE